MCQALRELMAKEIDEELTKAEARGEKRGESRGRTEGISAAMHAMKQAGVDKAMLDAAMAALHMG